MKKIGWLLQLLLFVGLMLLSGCDDDDDFFFEPEEQTEQHLPGGESPCEFVGVVCVFGQDSVAWRGDLSTAGELEMVDVSVAGQHQNLGVASRRGNVFVGRITSLPLDVPRIISVRVPGQFGFISLNDFLTGQPDSVLAFYEGNAQVGFSPRFIKSSATGRVSLVRGQVTPPSTDTTFFLQIAEDGRSFSFNERVFGHLTPRPTPVAVVGDFNGWVSSGVNSSLISGRYVVRFFDFGTQFAIGSCTKLTLFAPSLPPGPSPWAQWGSEVDQLTARNPGDPRLKWFYREENGGWSLQVTRLAHDKGALGCVSGPTVALTITNKPTQLTVGQTFQLTFQVTGSSNQSVSCVTSNESVIRTTDAGFLQAMGLGTARIDCVAAADNSARDSVTIQVVEGAATPCTFIANVHCVDSSGDLWFRGNLATANQIQVVGWNNNFTAGPNAVRQSNGHFRLQPGQVSVEPGVAQCISLRTSSGFIDITDRVRGSGQQSFFCGSEEVGFSSRVIKTAAGRFST